MLNSCSLIVELLSLVGLGSSILFARANRHIVTVDAHFEVMKTAVGDLGIKGKPVLIAQFLGDQVEALL
jgi:hypothetical protein